MSERYDKLIELLEQDGGAVPCSRYGHNSAECAPWAVAMLVIYEDANGAIEQSDEEFVDWAMGLVVNDHDDVENLVREHGGALLDTQFAYLVDEVAS